MHLNITIAATRWSSQCFPPPSKHPVYLPRSHRQPPLWKCQLRSACFSSLCHALKRELSLFTDHKDRATVHCTPLMLWGKTQTNSQLTFSKVLNLPF